MTILTSCHGAGAYALGLLVTLVLAAHLTPRSWWRRPNAGALLILVGGAWGLGSLLLAQLPAGGAVPAPQALNTSSAPAVQNPTVPPASALAFRTHDDLNLRSAASVDAPRLLVVPAGTIVQPTGARRGDWWQLAVDVAGHAQTGWASSLWLRRADEVRP